AATGNTGPADSADPAMGASTWLWDQRGDPESLRRAAASGYRFAVSGAAPAGEAEVGQGGMANFGEQATGKVLSIDVSRKKATDKRAFQVVTTLGRDRGCLATGRVRKTKK